MKKIISISTLVISIICYVYGEDFSFNLNTLQKGDKIEKEIWLHNNTSGNLILKNVETGCVCTKAQYKKNPVPTGDSTKIKIIFSAKDPGAFYKRVVIKTNKAENNSTVTLRGRVK